MNYQITSDNIQVSPSMENLAKEKMKKIETKLTNVYDEMKSFRIVMNSLPDQQFQVKIHSMVHGKEYFTDESAFSLEHALINATGQLEKTLDKNKAFFSSKEWKAAREAKRVDQKKSTRRRNIVKSVVVC